MSCALQFSDGKEGVKRFQVTLEPLRKALSEYPFLGGKTGPSYADIVVFGFFMVHTPPHLSCYPSAALMLPAGRACLRSTGQQINFDVNLYHIALALVAFTKVWLWVQFAYAISPIKLLEMDDPLHAWRSRMFEQYGSVTKEAVGFQESL